MGSEWVCVVTGAKAEADGAEAEVRWRWQMLRI